MADIVVVDDEDAVRGVIVRVLERDGHVVRAAVDGASARELLRERVPDLLLSDVYMPAFDGLDLLERLRKEYPALRMVVMSGGGNVSAGDVLAIARTLGAKATIEKPIGTQALRDVIRRALD